MEAMIRRALRVAPSLITNPVVLVDRLANLADRLTDRPQAPLTPPLAPEALWPALHLALGMNADLVSLLAEQPLADADALLANANLHLPPDAPFSVANSAEKLLGHVAYVICRLLRPDAILETGVAYGSMTTYLLTALDVNGHGILYSIDLPSSQDRAARLVGRFVPERLRGRWSLHLGGSRRLMPKVLRTIGPVGVFVHDSLHTRRSMSREFATVTPYLARHSAVISDDVHCNRAFEDWAQRTATHWSVVRQPERHGWLGVAVLSDQQPVPK
jgi:Methyltransferase domain